MIGENTLREPPEYVKKAFICALYSACHGTPKRHVPPEAIRAKMRNDARPYFRKALKWALREGIAQRKGGTKSYAITPYGIQLALEICFEE